MAASRNCTVTNAAFGLLLYGVIGSAIAAPVSGSVVQTSGTLLAKSTDGAVRVLSNGSALDAKDRLVSMPATYAEVRLADGTDMVLGPNSQLVLEQVSLDSTASSNDRIVVALSSGSVRIQPGTISREAGDRFTFKAGDAVATVHGSFIARYQGASATAFGQMPLPHTARMTFEHGAFLAMAQFEQTDVSSALADAMPPLLAQNTIPTGANGLNPGLYVQVLDGAINVSNGGGTQNFTAGQFGYTPSFQQPPVILPQNPGLQFTPPPSFSATTGSQSATGGSKPGAVDCQVR